MRLAFVVSDKQYDVEKFPGGVKKIDGQVKAFRDGGIECQLLHVTVNTSLVVKVARRLPFFGDGTDWDDADLNGFDALYMRRPLFVNGTYLRWLKNLKTNNPSLKVLYEIPTYPYDDEMRRPKVRLLLLKDKVNRGKLRRYVDRVVDLSGHEEIFGIPTIQIKNGIDLNDVEERLPTGRSDVFRMLCVASFEKWHGVDRLLRGIANYYSSGNSRRMVLHLVGDGRALGELRRLSDELSLGDMVYFHGRMKPEEFGPLYDECDLAVASLGLHRIGINLASTLKTREYLAKGVPFVFSGEIDVFRDEPVDFCLQIPADESPVDMLKLLEFCDGLYERETPIDLTKRIRRYAEQHVSMDAAMKPVIEYLKKGCDYE